MSYLLDDMVKTAAEEMSEKERYNQEIAKFKRRNAISNAAVGAGALTNIGLNVRDIMGKGNTPTTKRLRKVSLPAYGVGGAGLLASKYKLDKANERYENHLKSTNQPYHRKKIKWTLLNGSYPTVEQEGEEKTAASSDIKSAGLMAAGGLGLTTTSLYGSLAMQKRLKKKYGDIDGVNETSILSGIGNDRATNRINPTREQRERAEKFRKSFNRLNFGSRVGMGVGAGLGTTGAAMLGDAISRR